MTFSNSKEFGELIKKVRKAQGMNQSELAGACMTGVRFIVDLEKGKPTVEFGKAVHVAAMLGIILEAQIPEFENSENSSENSSENLDGSNE